MQTNAKRLSIAVIGITIFVVSVGITSLTMSHYNQIVYAQSLENNELADELALALLKDRKEGHMDGEGPHFNQVIEDYENDLGAEFNGSLNQVMLNAANRQLAALTGN